MSAITLRPLSTGEILDQAFGLFRREFATLLAISVVCSGVPLLVGLSVQARGGVLTSPLLWLASLLLSVIGSAVATGSSTYVVSGAYLNHQVTAGDALRRAMPWIWRLTACSFGLGLLVGFGFLLLLVPGFIALSGCILCFTALVVEDLGAQAAIGRSWELTRGFRWRMLGLLFVFAIVIYIPFIGIGIVAALFGGFTPVTLAVRGTGLSTEMVVVGVLGALVQVVMYPFLYCILVTAYYDLRVRKEGFDLELLASTLTPAQG